jgi:hypothetical protein
MVNTWDFVLLDPKATVGLGFGRASGVSLSPLVPLTNQ